MQTVLIRFIRAADFITVHMPVTPETKNMLNAVAFTKMKPGVKIVNCARGEIIAENDLIAALESGKVGGAALDVFAVEPMAADHPFRKQANLILTPHLGASTERRPRENVRHSKWPKLLRVICSRAKCVTQ